MQQKDGTEPTRGTPKLDAASATLRMQPARFEFSEGILEIIGRMPQCSVSALKELRLRLNCLPKEEYGAKREHLLGVFDDVVKVASRLVTGEIKETAELYKTFGLGAQANRLLLLLPKARDAHLNGPFTPENWFNPLSRGDLTLRQVLQTLSSKPGALLQSEVPLIIQLVENPKYDLPVVDLFPGATDLMTHDCIHVILGRGLMPKDEAFVLGFTMGSTDRMTSFKERLFLSAVKYFYPKEYRFSAEEERIYKDAVHLGYVSRCKPLSKVDYREHMDNTLSQIRAALGIEEDLLLAYYAIEKRSFPNSPECVRLV